ncbi:STAS domain-containing protein [Streptomyces sp. NBC_01261]|uniref:STAS domain-containing protein n=1 Tax=Streptomyces sp. NBC_01261 TaxID=2903802 RepID=UPI002E316952|nr:STAS domain-containing protein [Streptomyces sp. NBC_01261]
MTENHTRSAPSRTVRSIDGATVVTWHGEVDLVTAIPLASRLDALTSGPHPDLVLDLRSVSFIDCSGLGVLCRARTRVLARNGRLRLVTGSGDFLRLLRVTGLDGVFEVHPHLPSAGGERPRPLPGTSPERPSGNASSAQATA